MKLKWVSVLAIAACSSGNSSSDGGSPNCNMVNGFCLMPSGSAAVRTQCGDVTDYCDKTGKSAPNLACLTTPVMPPATPAMVTLTGFVHVFSNGPDSKGVSVQIFDATSLTGGADPSTVTPLATIASSMLDAQQRACDMDGKIGCTLPLAGGCTTPTCPSTQYCRNDGTAAGVCSDRLRWEAHYSLANIPTNKQLVIRTAGANYAADTSWANLVSWNVYLSTADRACANSASFFDTDCINTAQATYQLNINSLSQADYANIPVVAGLGSGIVSGLGAVAGEIHDCDNVRVANLSVGVKPSYDKFSYFNGNPIKTVPDPSRTGTDRLGLYTALDVPPGKASVQAGGSTDGTSPLIDFGSFDAYVYKDTVSVVNVNGGRPKQ
jgi:hypothetical protein